jgi:hypothetical protein
MASTDFPDVFVKLQKLLSGFESNLLVKANSSEKYSLNTPYSEQHQKELFFGAVVVMKNYVNYHLMPIYVFPELLENVTPKLKKRMQGKSCFNFKTISEIELLELRALTLASCEKFVRDGLIKQS